MCPIRVTSINSKHKKKCKKLTAMKLDKIRHSQIQLANKKNVHYLNDLKMALFQQLRMSRSCTTKCIEMRIKLAPNYLILSTKKMVERVYGCDYKSCQIDIVLRLYVYSKYLPIQFSSKLLNFAKYNVQIFKIIKIIYT